MRLKFVLGLLFLVIISLSVVSALTYGGHDYTWDATYNSYCRYLASSTAICSEARAPYCYYACESYEDRFDCTCGGGSCCFISPSSGNCAKWNWIPRATCCLTSTCPAGMVSYWKLESDGTDSYGTNPLSTIKGTVAWENGVVGKAMHADPWGILVQNVNVDGAKITGNFTIEAWINPASLTSLYGAGKAVPIVARETSVTKDAYQLKITDEKLTFCQNCIADKTSGVKSSTRLTANVWQHVAVVYNDNLKIMKFYINGKDAGSSSFTFSPQYISSKFSRLYIATAKYGDTNSAYYRGWIDEVAIYDEALSDAQIQQHNSSRTDYCTITSPPAPIPPPEQGVCDFEDDIIMRLSDTENAHGSLWDGVTTESSQTGKFALQLKEHKDCTDYNPNIEFIRTPGTTTSLRMKSDTGGLGNAYAFAVFDKSFLDGKKIKINWSTSASYSLYPSVLRIYDGEYDQTSTTDFTASVYPLCGLPSLKGNGLLQDIKTLYYNNAYNITTATVNLDNSSLDKVTLFVWMDDAWNQEYGDVDIHSLEILDQANNVLMYADLSGNIVMEQTGTYADYGKIGTTNVTTISTETYYPVKICYDEIFGSKYDGASPHTCNSNNRVLSLSSPFNAHASVDSSPVYSTNVCYGNLSCVADSSSGNSCSNGGQIVVRLAQNSNSHISTANNTNYPVKICCKPGTPPVALSGAYWADMIDRQINQTNVSARVKLVVAGTNIQNREINYTVYKVCSGLGCIPAFFFGDKVVTTLTSYGFTTWKTNETGEFYFVAKITGMGSSHTSPVLSVDEGDLSPPVVRITSPKDKQMYFLLENLNFSASIVDPSGFVNFTWTLGDGNTRTGNTQTGTNLDFTYPYSSAAQKNIILEGVGESGLSGWDRVSILILNSSYMLAYIDEPKWGVSLNSMVVIVNASSTYAVNGVHTGADDWVINCIAGNCPSQTEGCPPPATGCHVSVLGTPNWTGWDGVWFNWSFDDGIGGYSYAQGNDGAWFIKMFSNPGRHTAVLKTSLNPDSETDSMWYNRFDSVNPQCADIDGVKYWYSGGKYAPSFSDCHRDVVADGSSEDCCPDGYECSENKCVPSAIEFCSEIRTEEECVSHVGDYVAVGTVEIDEAKEGYCRGKELASWNDEVGGVRVYCSNMTGNCRCVWNNGNCEGNVTYTTSCSNGDVLSYGDCLSFVSQISNCSSGYRLAKWEYKWVGVEKEPEKSDCERSGERRLPCPAQLGFISVVSVIIAIVLIIVFYIISRRKVRDSRKKKRI